MAALALSLLAVGAAGQVGAQTADPTLADLTIRLAGMTAVTGYEQAMVDTLVSLVPGAARDRAGNAVLALGAGDRARLVVCPVSEPGYVVGNVRADGWMTLRRAPGRTPPEIDRQLEGQRVTAFGRRGALAGVVGVRSIHLTRGRGAPETAFTVDSAYLDLGASSAPEVTAAGVGVLTPVAIAKRPQRYGADLLAAPVAARRAACAALVLAARRAAAERGMVPRNERLVVAFVIEQELARRGIATVAATRGPFEETLLVDGAPGSPGELLRAVDTVAARYPALGKTERLSLAARYPGTPVETVSLTDADSLQAALVAWVSESR